MGGVSNNFGYYTKNMQERSGIWDVSCMNGSNPGAFNNFACGFWDRADSTGTQSGPSHFTAKEIQTAYALTQSASNGWGLVLEGTAQFLSFSGGTCGGTSTAPRGYVSISGTGAVNGVVLTYGGSTCTPTPTATVNGAVGSSAVINVTCCTSGAVTALSVGTPGSGYNPGYVTGGLPDDVSSVTITGATGDLLAGGIFVEGSINAHIGYTHCETMSQDCISWGYGSGPMAQGTIDNIDSTGSVLNLVHLYSGGDGLVNIRSLFGGSGLTNLIQDDVNSNIPATEIGRAHV
jgi:hypothetical protein